MGRNVLEYYRKREIKRENEVIFKEREDKGKEGGAEDTGIHKRGKWET